MNYVKSKVTLKNGEVRYEVKFWGTGKARSASGRRFKTQAERERFIRETLPAALDKLSNPPPLIPAPPPVMIDLDDPPIVTMQDAFQYYKKNKFTAQMSVSTKLNFEGYWKELAIGDMLVANFTKSRLRAIELSLLEKGNKQKTANNKVGFLRTILKYLVKHDKLEFSPVAVYEVAKPPEAVIEFWQLEDAQDFLAFA